MSIHNVERRLETALKNLENIDITSNNKIEIRKFLNFIGSHGCSIARQCKYIYPLENIARWLNMDYIKASKKNIEELVIKIYDTENEIFEVESDHHNEDEKDTESENKVLEI